MDLPKRKPNRLQQYDYSSHGAYFITFCTQDRKNLLWKNVGASVACPQDVILSEYGRIAEQSIQNIPQRYPMVSVDHYVIMPNHIHLLLRINLGEDGRAMLAPT